MLDYDAAAAVAAIVRTGSFEKAAKALNVTPSAISQRVKQLEERMGAVLVEGGIPCRATDKGAWLCRHMELVGQLENDLVAQIPELGDVSNGRVTDDVAVNADSLGTWFLPAMAGFSRRSNVMLNIAVDDQDYTVDWLKRGRVLAAVTSMPQPAAGCTVTALGHLRYVSTASPEFMQRYFAEGGNAEAMSQAPVLTFNNKDTMQGDWLAANFGSPPAPPTSLVKTASLGFALNDTLFRLLFVISSHICNGDQGEASPQLSLGIGEGHCHASIHRLFD